jgi:hypothetical protein
MSIFGLVNEQLMSIFGLVKELLMSIFGLVHYIQTVSTMLFERQ